MHTHTTPAPVVSLAGGADAAAVTGVLPVGLAAGLAAVRPFAHRLPFLEVIPRSRWLSLLFAFRAGSVVLDVVEEELPPERQSRFWAFAASVVGYSALLPAVWARGEAMSTERLFWLFI